MAGRVGGAGGKDSISSAPLEETGAVGGADAGAGAAEVADYAGAPNAKRTVRAKSVDMGGLDLMSKLNAQLEQKGGGDAAALQKDAKDLVAWTRDISGVVPTEELDARIAQARELLGSGKLDKASEKSVRAALTGLSEISESQAGGEQIDAPVMDVDSWRSRPAPELEGFDATMDKLCSDGISAKDAAALVALGEKAIRESKNPEQTYMDLNDRFMTLSETPGLKSDAQGAIDGAGGKLWVTMQKSSMAQIDAAAKTLGDQLKAGAATLKPPLSNVDPKSLVKADAGDSCHLAFKLKSGKTGTYESAEGKALSALLAKDPKLASVTVGVPAAFIGEEPAPAKTVAAPARTTAAAPKGALDPKALQDAIKGAYPEGTSITAVPGDPMRFEVQTPGQGDSVDLVELKGGKMRVIIPDSADEATWGGASCPVKAGDDLKKALGGLLQRLQKGDYDKPGARS